MLVAVIYKVFVDETLVFKKLLKVHLNLVPAKVHCTYSTYDDFSVLRI